MYIHMCVYVCVHTHICAYKYICNYTHACIYIYIIPCISEKNYVADIEPFVSEEEVKKKV